MELSNKSLLHREKYKILSKISQGNFGITYLAEQTSLDRKVCIKEFFFRGFCERSGNGQVTVTSSGKEVAHSFLRKFMREAKRLSKFDHPNIVKVIDVFEENGTAYMVMDYVDGETLQQLVDRTGKLMESEALGYILPLCDALEVVHEKGLLHLDIKPSNILIKKYINTPVLIDFGISKFTEASGEDHATTTPVALTKGYAPLEQYGQDLTKLTALTDVYSVAATLYKLVTGLTPPEAAVIVQDGLKPPKEINPTISGQLNSIILQSLSVKPINRALSINKLKADLMMITQSVVVPETDRNTEVLYFKGVDEKKKQAVAQKTEVETDVLNQKNKPESMKPDSLGSEDVKNLESTPKPTKQIALWLLLSAAIIVILFSLAKSYYSVPNISNEALKINTGVNSAINQYDIVSLYSDGLAAVRKNNKWGYINSSESLVIPLIYDEVGDFNEGKAIVKLNGTRLEIDKNGEEVQRAKNNRPVVHDISSQETTNGKTIIYENPVTDIDGNIYKTVRIGNQVWMAENLKVTHYRNGDPITKIEDGFEWIKQTSGAYCYLNNNEGYNIIYGCLYNGFAVSDYRNIAPLGWHIPSKTEWERLVEFVGGAEIAGGKLKEAGNLHWPKPGKGLKVNATNSVGFNALPSGCRYHSGGGDGSFESDGFFNAWTSTVFEEEKLFRIGLNFNFDDLDFSDSIKQLGFSLRCVKDN